ncbi:SacI homology domain-containing protein [Zopfochytrium polystomum]|nr:SacI homology domain-containing protein [Zopfochytrium polystomum]
MMPNEQLMIPGRHRPPTTTTTTTSTTRATGTSSATTTGLEHSPAAAAGSSLNPAAFSFASTAPGRGETAATISPPEVANLEASYGIAERHPTTITGQLSMQPPLEALAKMPQATGASLSDDHPSLPPRSPGKLLKRNPHRRLCLSILRNHFVIIPIPGEYHFSPGLTENSRPLSELPRVRSAGDGLLVSFNVQTGKRGRAKSPSEISEGSTNSRYRVTLRPISELSSFASRKKSFCGWFEIFGVLGILDLKEGPHLIVIVKRRFLGKLEDHGIYRIEKVAVLPFEAAEADYLMHQLSESKLSSLEDVSRPFALPTNASTPALDFTTLATAAASASLMLPSSSMSSSVINIPQHSNAFSAPPSPKIELEEPRSSYVLPLNDIISGKQSALIQGNEVSKDENLDEDDDDDDDTNERTPALLKPQLDRQRRRARSMSPLRPFYALTSTIFGGTGFTPVDTNGSEDGHGSRDGSPLPTAPSSPPSSSLASQPNATITETNRAGASDVAGFLGSSTFFTSYDDDITRTLQWKVQRQEEKRRMRDAALSLGVEGGARGDEYDEDEPLWKRADSRFFWNENISAPLIEADAHRFILPIMQGFVQIQPNCVIHHDPFSFSLISRRSKYRAGLRYERRGVDLSGRVANFVETEMIASSNLNGARHAASFVQIRGSIPLFWGQIPAPNVLNPTPILEDSDDNNEAAARKHFSELEDLYGQVLVVDLLSLHGREEPLGSRYRSTISRIIQSNSSPTALQYREFDFHEQCKGLRYDRVSNLVLMLESEFAVMQHFWTAGDQIICKQKGVFRTNCLDCLDRTNVVQSALARYALNLILFRIGIQAHPEDDVETNAVFEAIFKEIWANNGDFISTAYTGTAALKGDYTRTGNRNFRGLLNDASNSLTRLYADNFTNKMRQASIDAFLGVTNTSLDPPPSAIAAPTPSVRSASGPTLVLDEYPPLSTPPPPLVPTELLVEPSMEPATRSRVIPVRSSSAVAAAASRSGSSGISAGNEDGGSTTRAKRSTFFSGLAGIGTWGIAPSTGKAQSGGDSS